MFEFDKLIEEYDISPEVVQELTDEIEREFSGLFFETIIWVFFVIFCKNGLVSYSR